MAGEIKFYNDLLELYVCEKFEAAWSDVNNIQNIYTLNLSCC